MIELRNDTLHVSCPRAHPRARLGVTLHRTLRIPDDGRDYPLPPSLGRFPLRHVDDFGERVPETWRRHGGVMLPMYQAEAMWLSFSAPDGYPFAVQVAAGKVDALTGETWKDGLSLDPQTFLEVPGQPWLDGYVVRKGTIRQFVAMPLGSGYSAEEQITGRAEFGGIQLRFVPLRREVWEREEEERRRREMERELSSRRFHVASPSQMLVCEQSTLPLPTMPFDMGLAPGGRMRQEVYATSRPLSDWDETQASRCFVHLANSLMWRSVTGAEPPQTPLTAAEYARCGMPWFDGYDAEREAVEATAALAGLRSVVEMGTAKGDVPLPENESVEVGTVVRYGPRREGEVREGAF
jgi:hypothetical protein